MANWFITGIMHATTGRLVMRCASDFSTFFFFFSSNNSSPTLDVSICEHFAKQFSKTSLTFQKDISAICSVLLLLYKLCVTNHQFLLSPFLSRKIFQQPLLKQLWNTFLDTEPKPQVSWSFLACLDHTLRNSCPVSRFEQSLLLIQCCYVSALFIWPARKICSSRHKIFFNTTNSPLRGISVAAICIKMRS